MAWITCRVLVSYTHVHGRRFFVGERELAVRVADLLYAGAEYPIVTLLPPDWTETLRISEHQCVTEESMRKCSLLL